MESVTIGVDLGDRHSRYCVVDEAARVVEEGRVRTTPEGMRRRFREQPSARVVMEVGTHSPWASRLLQELGHEVVVANPRRLKFIHGETNKSDRADAEQLARVGRMDPTLLRPIQHRGAQAQGDLAVVRSRDALVRARAQLVTHARGSVKAVGARLPACSTAAFARKVLPQVPQELRPALNPVLEAIEVMTRQIRAYERQIEALCARYPATERLRQVKGVGALTALAYVLVIEDPERFRTSRAVGPYLGLRPKQRQTGESDPQLGISKAGDAMLRRLLVGSGHYILGPFGPDCELREWGLSLAARGGSNAKKRAAVAVARKLAVLLHHLWVSGQDYDPWHHSTTPPAEVDVAV
jgi:transposase